MKNLIFAATVILASSLSAQNPDGKFASLHVTPMWMWGDANFQRTTTVWYPQTQASNSQSVTSNNFGVVNFPIAFGINTLIKIPATENLSLSLMYSFQQRFEEDSKMNNAAQYFSQYNSLNGSVQTFAFTVSVYNLFSLSME